jgi:hypothetical protein
MDATERGAFCHSCQTEVIDFSAMTDREVIEYLEKHKAGCGRFRKDQLETKLVIPKLDNGIFRWRAVFLGVLSFLSARNILAQSNGRATMNQNSVPKTELKDTKQYSPCDTVILPEISVLSTYKSQRYITGIVSMEIPQIKPIEPSKKTIEEAEPPVQKHKALNWFRRLFRIKKKY